MLVLTKGHGVSWVSETSEHSCDTALTIVIYHDPAILWVVVNGLASSTIDVTMRGENGRSAAASTRCAVIVDLYSVSKAAVTLVWKDLRIHCSDL